MSNLGERVAYLKGLADGMQIGESTNEGKLLKAVIDVLDDIALTVDDIEEIQEELSEQVDTIDEDLAQVEDIIFDECCEEEEDEDEACLGEIECPHCNELICIGDDIFDEDANIIKCPSCGKEIEVEWDCDCQDCSDHND